ncbi:transcription antitermination factor NusB, partial [Acinetobacter baumannii]
MQENTTTKRKFKPIAKGLVKPKLTAGFASRKVALDSLIQTEKKGTFANVVLAAAFKKQELSERDRAFVTALVQGV